MKLDLAKRPCHVSNAMQGNTEKHGDEDVGALDLSLDGIVLKKADLEALLGDGAFGALYRTDMDMPEIRFTMLATPYKVETQFEGASVELWLGMYEDKDAPTLTFSDCKVRGIELTPQAGGLTLCKLKMRTTRPPSDDVACVFDYLNTHADIAVADAKVAQSKKTNRNQGTLALPEADEKCKAHDDGVHVFDLEDEDDPENDYCECGAKQPREPAGEE